MEPDRPLMGVPGVDHIAALAPPLRSEDLTPEARSDVHPEAPPEARPEVRGEVRPEVRTPTSELAVVQFADFYREGRERIARALSLTLGDHDLAVEAGASMT